MSSSNGKQPGGEQPTGLGGQEDELGARLKTALLASAEEVEPRGDGLTRIRARTRGHAAGASGWARFRTRWLANPAVAALGSTAVVIVGAVVVVGAGQLSGHPVSLPGIHTSSSTAVTSTAKASTSRLHGTRKPSHGSTGPTSTGRPTRTAPVVKHVAVPVYTVSKTSGGYAVSRTSREITVEGSKAERHQARTAAALDALFTSGGDAGARASDAGIWASGTAVDESHLDGSTLVVDLNGAGGSPGGAGADGAAAQAALKQLVYTGLDATPGASAVRVTVGGAAVSTFWDALPVDGALTKGSTALTRPLNVITSPADGSSSASPVTISGNGSYEGGSVTVHVTDGQGTVVSDEKQDVGSTGFEDWSATLTLDPGTYTVETYSSPGVNAERVTITVTG